jgi:type I restriction enzyme, S subunit
VNMGEMFGYEFISDQQMSRVALTARELSASGLQDGDLLFGRRSVVPAGAGKCSLVLELREPLTFESSIIRVRLDKSKAFPPFYYYYFASPAGRSLVSSIVAGTNIKGIRATELRELAVPLPSMSEQQIIASALRDADALIESLEQLIAKKSVIKEGAMQELLTGNRRLPGFTGKWEVKNLEELFEITSSKRVFQSDWRSEGIPFYRARELAVLGATGRVDNELFIRKSLYEEFKSAYGVPEAGDLLVTGVGTLGKVYVVTDDRKFYFKDGNIIWFKNRGSVSPMFLRQLYLTNYVIKQIANASGGTTVGTYTIAGAKKTEIPFPMHSEQSAIAEILEDMDAEISALEGRLSKSIQLKQGMMQELLTGRIRLI